MDSEAGGEDDFIFVQGQREGCDGEQRVFKCVVDPSTGNLLFLEDVGEAFNNGQEAIDVVSDIGVGVGNGDNASSSAETFSVVRELESGEYVLESFDPLHPFQPLKTSGDGDGNEDGDFDEDEELPEHNMEDNGDDADAVGTFQYDQSCSQSQSETTTVVLPERIVDESAWYSQKIFDLIGCIQHHEQKFRNWSKVMKVWSVISADMRDLGYSNCNKDECSKKWSNLHRTWRKVKMRPKASRTKWKYYNEVSNLIQSMSSRHREKTSEDTRIIISLKTNRLMLKLMGATKSHQNAVHAAEQDFKSKVDRLNEERDKILCDIKEILECK